MKVLYGCMCKDTEMKVSSVYLKYSLPVGAMGEYKAGGLSRGQVKKDAKEFELEPENNGVH